MSTGSKSDFLVISRGKWDGSSSKADIEDAIGRFYEWYEAKIASGSFKPSSRLTTDAALVTREGIRSDGPFAEGKEVIGGYWFIVAESLAAAAAVAAENPVLKHGLEFEIRPLVASRASAYEITNETPAA